MEAQNLVPISETSIRLGKPLPFAILDAAGSPLLAPGEVPRSERHAERLQEIGMVEAAVVARLETDKSWVEPAATAAGGPAPGGSSIVKHPTADASRAADCPLTAQRIPSGTTVQLSLAGESPRRVSGTLIGVLPRCAVYLGLPTSDPAVPLPAADTTIGFRCVHGTDIVGFEARVLRRESDPFPLIVLACPSDISLQRFRRHLRCSTQFDAAAINYTASDRAVMACRITNISAGGMQLECAAGRMAVGDQIGVDLVLPGPSPRQALKLMGAVRNVAPAEETDRMRCGVEFSQLGGNERLLVEHFVLRTLSERPRMSAVR